MHHHQQQPACRFEFIVVRSTFQNLTQCVVALAVGVEKEVSSNADDPLSHLNVFEYILFDVVINHGLSNFTHRIPIYAGIGDDDELGEFGY